MPIGNLLKRIQCTIPYNTFAQSTELTKIEEKNCSNITEELIRLYTSKDTPPLLKVLFDAADYIMKTRPDFEIEIGKVRFEEYRGMFKHSADEGNIIPPKIEVCYQDSIEGTITTLIHELTHAVMFVTFNNFVAFKKERDSAPYDDNYTERKYFSAITTYPINETYLADLTDDDGYGEDDLGAELIAVFFSSILLNSYDECFKSFLKKLLDYVDECVIPKFIEKGMVTNSSVIKHYSESLPILVEQSLEECMGSSEDYAGALDLI
jgi:hypothetical protein